MSNAQPPYGQQPAPWSPYPGGTPSGGYPQQPGYPQQGGYAPPSNYPTPEAYPPQQPGMYAPPSGYGQPQSPYAPPPYAPVPTPPVAKNLVAGGVVAALGGAAALIGFFAVPFYTVSASYLGQSQSSTAKGTDFTKSGSTTTGSNVSYPYLWIVVVAAIIALGVGLYIAFGMKNSPAARARSSAMSLIGLGIVSIGILFYVFSDANSKIKSALANAGLNSLAGSGVNLSYGFSAGFWLCVVGMVAAVVGGIMVVTQAKS